MICDRDNHYTTINLEALQEAMCVLSNSAFKLWMFYEQNRQGIKVPSGPAIAARWGLKRSSYYNAFEQLVELGYLEKKTDTYYIFHERAPVHCMVEVDKDETF